MIESIELRNFQTHRRKTIVFDPRVTIIIGASDEGKSSLLRAIRWACLNRFDGPADSFINWESSFAKVTLAVDGRKIVRAKGGKNSYTLDGKQFRAFGDKVPPEIADLLLLTEQNFQGQLDPHFWFSESAGQVSRELNQVVNLAAIDETLAAIATRARQARSELEVCRKRAREAKIARDKLTWVPSFASRLSTIEHAAAQRALEARRIEALRASVIRGQTARNRVKRAARAAEAGFDVLAAGKIAVEQRSQQLRPLIRGIDQAATLLVRRPRDLPPLPESNEKQTRLATIIKRIQEATSNLCQAKRIQHKTAARLAKAKLVCPTCGQVMCSPCSAPTST